MNFKKLLFFCLLAFTLFSYSQETTKLKFYGFIGNDFNFNSRQNVEMVDGLVQLFPKPISLNSANKDINATPQAELLSVNTRLGIDITGTEVFGAKTSGKIEADFAGFGTSFYVFRIRQAYFKLNWNKTELLVGQTWHPLFGSVVPVTFSINGGAPFQPFNRSPQIRLKQTLTSTLSLNAAALYEMQYASFGPNITSSTNTTPSISNVYLRNAMLPDVFAGFENKTTHWLYGAGADLKTIKPDINNKVTSVSAVAYAAYNRNKFQIKGKSVFGENLSDQLMLGGYGVSSYASDSLTVTSFTNFRNLSSWVNAVYGNRLQVGLLLGLSQNLGTNKELAVDKSSKFLNYGYGFFDKLVLNRLYRVAPQVSYNLSNMKFGLEYDLTSARYGTLQRNGLAAAANAYSVDNHRLLLSVMYIF